MMLSQRCEEGHQEAPTALGKHSVVLRVGIRRDSGSYTGSAVSRSRFDLGQEAKPFVALVPLPTTEIQISSL